jgi:hypothetical protein
MSWTGMTPQDRLSQRVGLEGGFWDTVYDIGQKVGSVADTVSKAAQTIQQVRAGNATIITQTGSSGTKVGVVPTAQGVAQSDTGKYLLYGGMALIAIMLLRRK